MNELSLFRRDPFAFSFDTQLPRMMRELMRFEDEPRLARFVPSFDVKETAEAFELFADLPGVKAENVDVRVNGNQLSITGKREAETKKEGENFHQVERTYGSFSRVFTLPDNAGHEVDAELKDGVLKVSIPKKPESKPRQISVKAG
ncbi:MAG: Hsp20 family protein [Myxococcales bacterium]|nr:Hsp20 family protein [Myxococcales bacterium]